MKKILLFCTLVFTNNIFANQSQCLYYLEKSNTLQDEFALYIVNNLKTEAYLSAREALNYTIKAHSNCKEYNLNLMKKIEELRAITEKYKP